MPYRRRRRPSTPPTTSSASTAWAIAEAKAAIIDWLEPSTGAGEGTVTYRLRDWLFSRQRYWGEPFPIVYDEHDLPVALPESMLPVELPEVDDYSPRTFDADDDDADPGAAAGARRGLGRRSSSTSATARRRTAARPTRCRSWAGSCWYYLRYLDPTNDDAAGRPRGRALLDGPARTPGDAGGVDLYVGGVEHAVLHLLYARFWHKVLFDLGHVSSGEPFHRLFNQGIHPGLRVHRRARRLRARRRGRRATADGGLHLAGRAGDPRVREDGQEPEEHGHARRDVRRSTAPTPCACTRCRWVRWTCRARGRPARSSASQRFLQRLWRNIVDEDTGEPASSTTPADDETRACCTARSPAVRTTWTRLRFNTAIARLDRAEQPPRRTLPTTPAAVAEPLVLMMAPLAPHVAEELWSRLGHDALAGARAVPGGRPRATCVEDTVTCSVQVQGKVRGPR